MLATSFPHNCCRVPKVVENESSTGLMFLTACGISLVSLMSSSCSAASHRIKSRWTTPAVIGKRYRPIASMERRCKEGQFPENFDKVVHRRMDVAECEGFQRIETPALNTEGTAFVPATVENKGFDIPNGIAAEERCIITTRVHFQ